ncbi:hypothetical protein GCM10009803_03180 [Microbacterium ginsengiterrae]
MRDADQQQGGGGRVDVRDEIRGVDAQHEGAGQSRHGRDGEHRSCTPTQCGDGAVGEEESELLEREPDQREVDETDRVHTAEDACRVHGDGPEGEKTDRRPRRALVSCDQGGKQDLADQEHAEEPQRLAEAVAGDADELLRNAGGQQHREQDAHRGDRVERRQEQAMDASGDEVGRRAALIRHPQVRRASGEAPDHEEQRHHLQEPAQRDDPRGSFAGVREHRAGAVDRDADHQRVDHHHTDHAQCADQVDPCVAPGSGWSCRSGCAAQICDGHRVLLGGCPRSV